MSTRLLKFHREGNETRKPKHLGAIDSSDHYFSNLIGQDLLNPGFFLKKNGPVSTTNPQNFKKQNLNFTFAQKRREQSTTSTKTSNLGSSRLNKTMRTFKKVKKDMINTQYILQDFNVKQDQARLKVRARENGNAVDWGAVKDGIFDNDLKCQDFVAKCHYQQELKEKQRLRRKPRFKVFPQGKKRGIAELRAIIQNERQTLSKEEVFEIKKLILLKIQDTFYRLMEGNQNIFKCQTLLNLRRRRIKNVVGCENDYCWEINYNDRKEDGGLGSGIKKGFGQPNKYKEAQFVSIFFGKRFLNKF